MDVVKHGESTARWTLDRAAARLRSAAGTTVALDVEGGGARFQVSVVRRVLEVPAAAPL